MIRKYHENDTDALISIWRAASALAHPFLYERYGFVLVEEYLHQASGELSLKMAMPSA